MAERLISAERREVSTPPAETRMWAKQAALPRLPVPDLGQTCMRYLRSVRPLLSGDEYRATLDAVAAFAVGGKGEELQRRLEKRRQEKHGSSWSQALLCLLEVILNTDRHARGARWLWARVIATY